MGDVRIAADRLESFSAQVFEHVGLSAEDAATQAHVLVWANLRGIDSHGVLRIPSYVASVARGGMNPHAQYRIERQTPATLLIEGDHAFGPVVTTFAMRQAIAKASQVGIGWAVIRNTTHQGAMGYYSQMAAEQGMAGLAMVCNPPNMAPTGARAAGVHNSPLSIAVPGDRYPSLCLDMATSVAAFGKIQLAVDKGINIPPGWALDRDGQPTTDATQARILLPAGGYKGYGLALLFECLTSLFAANPLLEPTLWQETPVRPGTQNSVVAAIGIGTFTDVAAYRQHVDRLIEGIKALPKAEGVDEIMVPGEPELRVLEERRRDGIPLPEGTARNLREVALRLGVPVPAELA